MKSARAAIFVLIRCYYRPLFVAGLVVTLWMMVAPPAAAQSASEPGVRVPVLGGHRFQPLGIFGDPFVRTFIRNATGLGKAIDLETPLYDLSGDPAGTLKGDLVFVTVDFEYMHAVRDWLGLSLQVRVLGRLGTNEQSLLAQGISTLTSMQLAWLFELYENENWFLSGTLNLWNSDLLRVNLLDWVNGIIDDGGISPDNSLVEKTPSLRWGGGVRAAYAPNDLFGFASLLETGYGESLDRSRSSELFLNLGIRGDIDLLARSKVPIGFVVGYYMSTFPETGDSSSNRTDMFSVRVNFTGRDDFSVGIESTNSRTKVPSVSGTINSTLTSLQLQYYF